MKKYYKLFFLISLNLLLTLLCSFLFINLPSRAFSNEVEKNVKSGSKRIEENYNSDITEDKKDVKVETKAVEKKINTNGDDSKINIKKIFEEAAKDFRIGPEDILEISVWKDQSLNKQLIVGPDGKISFPLVGEFKVEGLTMKEVEDIVSEKINKYVPEAVINIMLIQVNSLKVYVIGKVARPGVYKVGKSVDVLQALSLAGGLTTYAKEKDIIIIRKENDKQRAISFNYDKVKKGKSLDENIMLQAGDVVVVP